MRKTTPQTDIQGQQWPRQNCAIKDAHIIYDQVHQWLWRRDPFNKSDLWSELSSSLSDIFVFTLLLSQLKTHLFSSALRALTREVTINNLLLLKMQTPLHSWQTSKVNILHIIMSMGCSMLSSKPCLFTHKFSIWLLQHSTVLTGGTRSVVSLIWHWTVIWLQFASFDCS